MVQEFIPPRGGWCPDLPDLRDFDLNDDAVYEQLVQRGVTLVPVNQLPSRVSLKSEFPIQGESVLPGTHCAESVLLLVKYLERLERGWSVPRSSAFLSHESRKLTGASCESPVGHRDTFKALKRLGAPPELLLPQAQDLSPLTIPPRAYAYAQDFRNLLYLRIDTQDIQVTHYRMRSFLLAGFPLVVGLGVPTSLTNHPDIPYRPYHDGSRSGDSLVVVGYDNNHMASTKGAYLVRTHWGKKWGNRGFGWLPYEAINKIALDIWVGVL